MSWNNAALGSESVTRNAAGLVTYSAAVVDEPRAVLGFGFVRVLVLSQMQEL